MKRISFILLLVVFAGMSANAEFYRVRLSDKGPGDFVEGSEKYNSALSVLSSRTVNRRHRGRMISSPVITERDVPIYSEYLSAIENLGAKICLKSKWFNYIVIDCVDSVVSQIRELEFVDTLMYAGQKANFDGGIKRVNDIPSPILADNKFIPSVNNQVYGISSHQNEHIGASKLHDIGVFGQGIRIGVIDGGFIDYDSHPYTYEKIIVYKDFLDFLPEFDTLDLEGKLHGSKVLSVMNAERDSLFKGIATGAEYLLARTETTTFESHLELDAMVSAIEWLEAEGTDIMSVSLGYRWMTDSVQSFGYEDFDGSTIIAKAFDMAYERGVLMVNSAGNEGPNPTTVTTPSDANKCIMCWSNK